MRLTPSASRLLRVDSERSSRGTVLSWAAVTVVISTARVAPAVFTLRMPPIWTPTVHVAANGTIRSGPVCAHAAVGLPRIVSTLRPMKFAMGVLMITAAFFAAAISAVVEFGAAETTSGASHVPASAAFSFWSPM